jgi:hypothetical protein
MDRYNTIKGSHKDILLLPLERRWREHLCQIPEPAPVKKEAEEPVRVEPEVRHPVSRPRIGAYAALVESASVRALPVRPPLRSSAATS